METIKLKAFNKDGEVANAFSLILDHLLGRFSIAPEQSAFTTDIVMPNSDEESANLVVNDPPGILMSGSTDLVLYSNSRIIIMRADARVTEIDYTGFEVTQPVSHPRYSVFNFNRLV